ncbi:hypothetical protein HYPSUDRAFT_890066 [Hypholoma sublateritium FD-334 SS-4]|uniref:Uncharacterized protein n=1 Tax=Hypholoma sublateritium (strain FD-334 SS-4) TaxID=945553 RepID=A0A0D2NKS5_HYPSF|nr:hypothetical protein HYPSUDRAFT_890066 [Hypholoma sublateritium FD-334 SS-4]
MLCVGYGHATRVSAFARHLLNLSDGEGQLVVYIVSSAPERVFADSIECGARYRFAEIDPVIVQPLAYRVDRRKSVEVLKKFLDKKDELLERERRWLLEVRAHCVLSDAAFLGCLAARAAGLPSILITNFSFDSVYSYLSTPLLDDAASPILAEHHLQINAPDGHRPSIFDVMADDPISPAELAPLVAQIQEGYRCAQLLVRLPGHIPMPSFFASPPLPSAAWVDVATRRLKEDILVSLSAPIAGAELVPAAGKGTPRAVLQAPLVVRAPRAAVHTPEGRARFLESIGVPRDMHGARVLVVSFGGQVFKRPASSRGSSRASSRSASREDIAGLLSTPRGQVVKDAQAGAAASAVNGLPVPPLLGPSSRLGMPTSRLATPNHIYIPGAPPASKPLASPAYEGATLVPPVAFSMVPPTPPLGGCAFEFGDDGEEYAGPRLLPDDTWIAVVCGVSRAQWSGDGQSGREGAHGEDELPPNFFVAPRDVYMPDLTAVGDVLLGKLGYGTVSECVDACTPFVYVSRPLFVEEHGLRRLLDEDGVGVELAREAYEAGEWAGSVAVAYARGRLAKERKMRDMRAGVGVGQREAEVRALAQDVVEWVGEWRG